MLSAWTCQAEPFPERDPPAEPADAAEQAELDLVLPPEWMLAPRPEEPPAIWFQEPAIEELPVPAVVEELVTPPPPRRKVWEGRVEFGANGSEGNSDRFATRYGGKLKRSTPRNLWTLDVLYSSSYAKNVQNENKMLADTRSEWPFRDTPWFVYTHGTTEYDAFTAYDLRVTSDSGFGYHYLNTGITTFKGRVGVGFSQEINSPSEQFTPEATVGFTYEHRLSERQKLIASGDVFPDLRDVRDFRAKSNASWEVKLDPPARLSLRLGVIDRYDSTPQGKRRNDLDYSTTVVWEF